MLPCTMHSSGQADMRCGAGCLPKRTSTQRRWGAPPVMHCATAIRGVPLLNGGICGAIYSIHVYRWEEDAYLSNNIHVEGFLFSRL